MKIALLYGIFGAGKTSMIRYLAEHLEKKYQKKVGLIIYEEGEVKIEDERFPLKILPKGCLPCETAVYFGQILVDLYTEEEPDIVMIEPSGTTLPRIILSAITYAGDDAGEKFDFSPTLNVVDPVTLKIFWKTLKGVVENGIRESDYVVINKIDTALEGDIGKAERIIREVEPKARVLHTSSVTCERLKEVSKILVKQVSEKYGVVAGET